jgi:hypothetical protein
MEVPIDVNTCGTCNVLAALPALALSAPDNFITKILEHMQPPPCRR